jgi:hypothetical protein
MYKIFTNSAAKVPKINAKLYGELATPRITDTGSRYLKKKISLASIFRTLSSRVGK